MSQTPAEALFGIVDGLDDVSKVPEGLAEGGAEGLFEAAAGFVSAAASYVKEFAGDSGLDGVSDVASGIGFGLDVVDLVQDVMDPNSSTGDIVMDVAEVVQGAAEATATFATTASEISVGAVSATIAEVGVAGAAAEFGAVAVGGTVAAGVLGAGIAGVKVGEFLVDHTDVEDYIGGGLHSLVGDEHALESVRAFDDGEYLEGIGHMAEGAGETIADAAEYVFDGAVDSVSDFGSSVVDGISNLW